MRVPASCLPDPRAVKRFLPKFFVILLAALGLAGPARAHASLVHSVPEAGAILLQAPPEIVLEFSEELDPAVSRVELLDAAGQAVDPGPGLIDPGAPRLLRLELEALPAGVYSAVWRVRSTVDGHVTNGSVGFSVGETSPAPSLLPPPRTPDPGSAVPSAASALARWLAYLTTALAVGSLSFGFLIWRPAYHQEGSMAGEADEAMRIWIRRLSLGSLAGLGLATLLFALVQALQTADGPSGLDPGALFSGRIGWLLGVRLILVILLGWLAARLPSPGAGSSAAWWLRLLLSSVILLSFSLQGHAAARGSGSGVALLWLHLAATTVWLGGLPMLWLALRQAGSPAAAVVSRFSGVALASVGILFVTGFFHFFDYIKTDVALLATTYGRAVIVKTMLFGLLLILGAINLLYLSPRLRRAGQGARQWLARTVRLEIVLGAVLLLAVGILSGVAPASEALQAHREQGIIETAQVDGVRLLVRIAPGQAGENEIGIEFDDPRPGAAAVPPEVIVRLSMTDMEMGTQQIQAASADGLRYTARGSYLSMQGLWDMELILRRPGYEDIRRTFELNIPASSVPIEMGDHGHD